MPLKVTQYDKLRQEMDVKWKSSPEGKDTESMVGVFMDKLSDVSQL